ncbi:hypothetical protein [Jannaschia aquimarina]|uniref:Peptidase S8/S53 domain-containing protein n=1 Tax=Jannaschia aquimarina TaxID=935700 RepID=A0A0D1CJP6_9RHOB|nr:hypothetical protein [Jannaschia aquimarina]KIT14942.1 hypothetical protein jaqu_32670 [Jannaschia aquimarina]SNS59993.1 hypothetical protein SAMN05421775_101592 [Jannaschia aquimarina]
MTGKWTEWDGTSWDSSSQLPDVHWWRMRYGSEGFIGEVQTVPIPLQPEDPTSTEPEADVSQSDPRTDVTQSAPAEPIVGKDGGEPVPDGPEYEPDALRKLLEENYGGGVEQPVPGHVGNEGFDPDAPWFPSLSEFPDPPSPETAITGVIDTGLPLSHYRTTGADGRTRILHAWMQGAEWVPAQSYLPFGREFMKADIDRLLSDFRIDPAHPEVDEEALISSAGLRDMTRDRGERTLARRVAHGAAVLGLAAGRDPIERGGPILLASLPGRQIVGLSGTFLEYFVIYAIYRMVAFCDLLWSRLPEQVRQAQTVQGYPLVINLSFGKQAGARDGASPLADTVRLINTERQKKGRSRLHVILPAGNENLLRGNAAVEVPSNTDTEIDLRVPVEDHTDTFVEIWSDPENGLDGLEISVAAPGAAPPPTAVGPHGSVQSLTNPSGEVIASLYAENRVGADTLTRKLYTLAVAATQTHGERPEAPSGSWRIRLAHAGGDVRKARINVQTDQSARDGASTGRRAHLFDAEYQRYDPTDGRVVDSCDYRPAPVAALALPPAAEAAGATVSRFGTLNALSHGEGLITVAGYRESDGRPAPYSSTGRNGFDPDFAMATDKGPATFGVLTSGAADGSTVAVRGTSFGCAMATRQAAAALRGRPGHGFDLANFLRASLTPVQQPPSWGAACSAKVGPARLTNPVTRLRAAPR